MKALATDYYPKLTEFEFPWKFYVVDNFLEASIFNFLCQLKDDQSYYNFLDGLDTKTNTGINDPKLITPDSAIKKSIKIGSKRILDSIDLSLRKHIGHMLPAVHYKTTELVSCDPGYVYGRHKDHKNKKISIVVFLWPQMSHGTIVYDKDDYEFMVQWKQNRAFIFQQETHGFHNYFNKTMYPRVTLNIYIGDRPNINYSIIINKTT